MGEKIKCVVWDLDNTIWDGAILEDGDNIAIKDGILDIIKALDERGILQSIASKNNFDDACIKLDEYGIGEYFLYPKINWNAKSESIKSIAKDLNIGAGTIAFVDDRPEERAEVSFSCPEVLCIDALEYKNILGMPRFTLDRITQDAKNRRLMYQSDIKRKEEEESFQGTSEEFLQTLDMRLTISPVTPEDLDRVEELTIRTHQLNSTGYTYSYEELLALTNSDKHVFLIAELKDKFGDYGKIGLALMEKNAGFNTIKLLLMSCRVMTRGIGTTLLIHLIKESGDVPLRAEFLETDRNRVMYITYKFMGFDEISRIGNEVLLEYSSKTHRDYPEYINVGSGEPMSVS